MPPEKSENGQFVIEFGRERHALSSIPSIEDSQIDEEIEQLISPLSQQSAMSFEFIPKEDLTTDDLWLILCGVCTEQQVKSNNCRRFHGMPMKRRRRKKNEVDSK